MAAPAKAVSWHNSGMAMLRFFGGIGLLIFDLSVQALAQSQNLEYLRINAPALYLFVTGIPFSVVLLLVAVIGIISGSIGIWKQRRGRSIHQAQEGKQELRASSIGGDVRIVGTVGRDYIEKQETHVHAAPLSEAQLAEFGKIDEFIIRKDEYGLRETFDFPRMLKFNILMARKCLWPNDVSPTEAEELAEFFRDGRGAIDLRFATASSVDYRNQIFGVEGKVFCVNTPKKYNDARELLTNMYSSSTLPLDVASALRDLEETVKHDTMLISGSLNASLALNKRNVRENDDAASDRHSAAWNRYWAAFVHLKPKADAISAAIRCHLGIK